jgi:hypothetical protein
MIYCPWVFIHVAFSWLVIVLSSDHPYDGLMSGVMMMYCSCMYLLMWCYLCDRLTVSTMVSCQV